MSTLKAFSEKERAYHQYQARQNCLRQQKSIEAYQAALRADIERAEADLEQARAAEAQARAAEAQERALKEQERAAKAAALGEIERLKALLRN